MSTLTEDNIKVSEQYEMEEMLSTSERADSLGNGDAEKASGREDNKVSYI